MLVLNELFAIWVIAFYNVPAIRAPFLGGIYRYIMLIGLAGWFGTSILINKEWLLRQSKTLFMAFGLIVFYLTLALLRIGDIANYIIFLTAFWIPYLMFEFYESIGAKKTIIRLTHFIIIAIISIILCTLFYSVKDPYLLRTVFKEGAGEITAASRKNIGALDFIYALELFVTQLWGIFFFCKGVNAQIRIGVLILGVLSLVLIFYSSSGFMVIGIVLMTLLIVLYHIPKGKRAFVIIMFAIVCAFLYSLLPPVLDFLAGKTDNFIFNEKLTDLSHTIKYGLNQDNSGSTASRIFAYRTDIELFFKRFLLGAGPYYRNLAGGVNGHSSLFGELARYGIFIAILTHSLMRGIRLKTLSAAKSVGMKIMINITYVMFWFEFIINPINLSSFVGLVMWFALPGIVVCINEMDKE